MLKLFSKTQWVLTLGVVALLAGSAQGALILNEIYLDPPGGDDIFDEYVEIKATLPGEAGMGLNGYYFIAIENEDNATHTGNAGRIDNVINLSSASIGSNGFLVITRPSNNFTVAPGTGVLTYSGSVLENGGATYMLINANGGPAPTVNQDLEPGVNDGSLSMPAQWSILDSIGIFSEEGEAALGLLYGAINFGPEPTAFYAPNYHGTGFEIEYLGRWGTSTGSTPDDWNVSNLTSDPLAGPVAPGLYRQSGDPQGAPTLIESSHSPQVPYGTILTNTLGAENYPVPEPSTFVMAAAAGFGLTIVGLRRRRRRR